MYPVLRKRAEKGDKKNQKTVNGWLITGTAIILMAQSRGKREKENHKEVQSLSGCRLGVSCRDVICIDQISTPFNLPKEI